MRLRPLVPTELTDDQLAVYNAIAGGARGQGQQHFALTDAAGGLTGPFGPMLHAPSVGGPLQELGSAIRFRTSLSDRVREIVILQVAQFLGSDFEWWAHQKLGRVAGLTSDELAHLAEGTFTGIDVYELACYEFVGVLLRSQTVTDDEYARATHTLAEQDLVELTVLVGYYRTLAQILEVFDIGQPEP